MSDYDLPPPDGDRPQTHPGLLVAIAVILAVGALALLIDNLRHHNTTPRPPAQFQQAGASSTPSPAPAGTSTTTTTTPDQGQEAAILNGYRAEQAAFFAAAGHFPVDPSYPGLAATMTGNELTGVRHHLTVARLQSQYLAGGTPELDPVVTSIGPDDTTATISDCLRDPSYIVYGPTGSTVTPAGTERGLEHVYMQLEAGTWKVAGDVEVSVGCNPGDL